MRKDRPNENRWWEKKRTEVTLLVSSPSSSVPAGLSGDVRSNTSLMNKGAAQKRPISGGRKTSSQEPLIASEEGESGGFEEGQADAGGESAAAVRWMGAEECGRPLPLGKNERSEIDCCVNPSLRRQRADTSELAGHLAPSLLLWPWPATSRSVCFVPLACFCSARPYISGSVCLLSLMAMRESELIQGRNYFLETPFCNILPK